MKWITRERPRVDRVACPWLIERFIDKDAEFIYVPRDQVMAEAARLGATPYDVPDVELGHHGPECSFDAFVRKHGLDRDPALAYMALVIRGADTQAKDLTPESRGVEALLEGVRLLHAPDDQRQREASKPVLDALYAHCQGKTKPQAIAGLRDLLTHEYFRIDMSEILKIVERDLAPLEEAVSALRAGAERSKGTERTKSV